MGWGDCSRAADGHLPATVTKGCCAWFAKDLSHAHGTGGSVIVSQYFHAEMFAIVMLVFLSLALSVCRDVTPLRRRQVLLGTLMLSFHLFRRLEDGGHPDKALEMDPRKAVWRIFVNACAL